MFQLNSERLSLIPLTLSQLNLLAENRTLLEQSLGVEPFGVVIHGEGFLEEFQSSLQSYIIPKVSEHRLDYQWFTLWQILHRLDNRLVGNIGMAGLPNEQGEVMIGYFTDGRYEGQGIMTEAVGLIANWIFENPDAQSVIADTLVDGFASQRVLQKNEFLEDGTTEEGLRWRKWR